jgi:hypothetical protein
MVGLDPAVELAERAHGAKPAPCPAVVRKRSAGGAAEPARGPLDVLRRHRPEYLMEAVGLGLYMIAAGLCATLLWYPGSPVAQAARRSEWSRILGFHHSSATVRFSAVHGCSLGSRSASATRIAGYRNSAFGATLAA